MREELNFFDIYPKVLLVGKESYITIKPLDEPYDFNNEKYIVKIVPLNYAMVYDFTKENSFEVLAKNNKIVIKHVFNKEQEYYINIYVKEHNKEEKLRRIAQYSIYALEEDLYSRIPLRGDLHAHSIRSDGAESPAIVAANYRREGFDFFALTDHYKYSPSLEAIEAYKDVNIDLNIIRGEEVHSPDNYVHIINFGGDSSVNEVYQKDTNKYNKEVQEIIKSLEISDEVDKFIYGACTWVSKKIRECNGLSIFCHPYWIHGSYNVPPDLSCELINNKVCDAFELLGGQTIHENNMQIALYNDIRIKGKNEVPIVGSSDSHGTIEGQWFNNFATLVFSNKNEKNKIIAAIKDNYSVAIEYEKSGRYRVYGSLRLVGYARFLLDNYYQMHKDLCMEEGKLMKEYHLGLDGSKEKLESLSGRCNKLLEKYFR